MKQPGRFSQNFRRRVAGHLREGTIDKNNFRPRQVEFRVRDDDGLLGLFHGGAEQSQLGLLPLQRIVGLLQFMRPLVKPRQRLSQLRVAAAGGEQHEHERAKSDHAVRDAKQDSGVLDRAEAGKDVYKRQASW